LAFIDVGTESKWLNSATAPVLSVPGMRAMTLRSRPAKTWLKSVRAATPSTTWDSTPIAASRARIVLMVASWAGVPMDRGWDATTRSSSMARSAENTVGDALAGTTVGVHVYGA
jgi:hypothetical protein